MSNASAVEVDADQGARTTDGPLPTVHLGGFAATVDACAWELDTDPGARRMRIWFLSLLGPQEAVRAIWARLIKGETATIALEAMGTARFCTLAPEGPRRWRFFSASLRTVAGYHGVLVPEAARYLAERIDFVLLPRSAEQAASLHYRFLNRRLDLPLHPLWASWLWERAIRSGETVRLDSWGVHAYRCHPNPELLAHDLGEAVRQHALPMPEDIAAETGVQERDISVV